MAPRTLQRYRGKRDFAKTPEPAGADHEPDGNLFVVQKHAARRLHYDLRLQFGNVLRSWAVTKGPSLDPTERRLAVQVEDHPLDYADFEGIIPAGEYGGGAVIVWDRGTWAPMSDPAWGIEKGVLKFRLAGQKLRGGFALIRLKENKAPSDNWLLIKEHDAEANAEIEIIESEPDSVISGRSVDSLADEQEQVEKPAKRRRRYGVVKPQSLTGARRSESAPRFIRPQLASPDIDPPAGDGWIHEIKFDGYRTLAIIDDGNVRFMTRRGHDWTERYGSLADPFAKIPCRRALIDGEIIVQGERGVSSFAALQDALREGDSHRLLFYAFDLLHLDGWDLTTVPLVQRKEALAGLVGPGAVARSALQLSEHVLGKGRAFLEQSSVMSLEGIISKRANSIYRSGRTRSWLKIKCVNREDFTIVGFTESKAAGGLAALLLAESTPKGLTYVGRVGTGWSHKEAAHLCTRLSAIRSDTPSVGGVPKASGLRWVEPLLAVEVEYAIRTTGGMLRHAVFKGVREDMSAPKPVAARKRYVTDADLASIWVTNPDRVMFGAGGPTKLELALYYARVGDWMLPEIVNRPVSAVRCVTGAIEDSFFQRHAMSGMPETVKHTRLREESAQKRGDFLYIEGARGLLALAQFGTVEFHPWGCRIDKPERPDRMIFDLDPDEDLRWCDVVGAALELREALVDLGLCPFVKTTGGKGLHIVVPLPRRHTWKDVHRFSGAIVDMMSDRAPKRYTASMAKGRRKGRIFIDIHRNVRGATAVGAYSLRTAAGAPVATPVAWDELRAIDDPAELNYATVPQRLSDLRTDPWADLDRAARALTQEMERAIAPRKRR